METKKHPSKNLELKKNAFFLIGLTFGLAITLIAFEYKHQSQLIPICTGTLVSLDLLEGEVIPISRPKQPLPPIKVERRPIISSFKIVETLPDAPVKDYKDLVLPDNLSNVPIIYSEPSVIDENEIFEIVEEMPEYEGGEMALFKFLYKEINYPQMAADAGISGKVYVSFIVEKDGAVSNVEIAKGIGGGCDEEALRAIKALKNWHPGKQRGKPVRVMFKIPINFTLK